MTVRFILFLAILLTFGCSRKLIPDRSQFLRLGEPAPTVDLSYYRSVQERPGQDSTLALALAISGGGSRAANFAVGVMLGLEEIVLDGQEDVLDQVDYLSTVSGGGFAGGAYINALYEHHYFDRKESFRFRDYVEGQVRTDLGRSYVAPLLGANLNPRLLFTPIDDGDALEKAIDDHVLGFRRRRFFNGGRSLRLGDLFVPRDSNRSAVRFPMHVANSSIIGTMAIFPFTPDILECYQVDGYSHRMRLRYMGKNFNAYQVPHAVGIKASGSFPVLISNSTLRSTYLPGRPFLHLMDGAMTDNLGFYTAVDLLLQDHAPRKGLLIIDADADIQPNTFSKRQGSVFSLRVLAGLTSSGLYARKNILSQELAVLQTSEGLQSFIFSFRDLIDNNPTPPPPRINPKVEIPRLIAKMKQDLNSLTDTDRQILYELTTNIGTKYTIRNDEQELLLLTGRKLVRMRADEIRATLRRH